ncbi:hypothetical protein ABC955_15845 [Citromicrobium bathyomarinum]
MAFGAFILTVLTVILAIVGLYVAGAVSLLRKLRAGWGNWHWPARIAHLTMALALIATPYFAYKAYDRSVIFRFVPAPLVAKVIEHRTERLLGVGPGGNETGFIVYRLTARSAAWATDQGDRLPDFLPGGSKQWRTTPVLVEGDKAGRWQRGDVMRSDTKVPDIENYLSQYGAGFRVDRPYAEALNRAMNRPGSFYSYGAGGRFTLVDPMGGKVYVAYAG